MIGICKDCLRCRPYMTTSIDRMSRKQGYRCTHSNREITTSKQSCLDFIQRSS